MNTTVDDGSVVHAQPVNLSALALETAREAGRVLAGNTTGRGGAGDSSAAADSARAMADVYKKAIDRVFYAAVLLMLLSYGKTEHVRFVLLQSMGFSFWTPFMMLRGSL